jgi:hypothetical protein
MEALLHCILDSFFGVVGDEAKASWSLRRVVVHYYYISDGPKLTKVAPEILFGDCRWQPTDKNLLCAHSVGS